MIKWLNKQLNERGSGGVTGMHAPTTYTKPPIGGSSTLSKYAIPSYGGMGQQSTMSAAAANPIGSVAASSPKSMSFAGGAGSANNSIARGNNFMSPARSQASLNQSLNDSGFAGRDSMTNQSVKVVNPQTSIPEPSYKGK